MIPLLLFSFIAVVAAIFTVPLRAKAWVSLALTAIGAATEPKLLIACGTEACSGGLFADSKAIDRTFFATHRVDLWLPGAPTHPMIFIDGIRTLLGKKNRN